MISVTTIVFLAKYWKHY